MFELDYRVVNSEYDDFVGQHGFFQLKCNGFWYGEIYSNEMQSVMDKVSIYDWFERLTRVVGYLYEKEYVVLSDVETYNTWIEFKKNKEMIIISIVKAEKNNGSRDIEFKLNNAVQGEWFNQEVTFSQFKKEILNKGNEYIRNIMQYNLNNVLVDKLRKKINYLQTFGSYS